MTNLFDPDDEAVKRSPLPELSTTNPAKLEVCPDNEAKGVRPYISPNIQGSASGECRTDTNSLQYLYVLFQN